MQLARLAERPSALFHGLLVLQTVATRWGFPGIDASPTKMLNGFYNYEGRIAKRVIIQSERQPLAPRSQMLSIVSGF